MIGTLINVVTILAGVGLGLLLRKGIPERMRDTVMHGLGLCVILIGVSGAIKTADTMCVIVSIVIGGLLGSAVNVEHLLDQLGQAAEKKSAKGDQSGFAKAFVTASLVYCVGAMAIVGQRLARRSHDADCKVRIGRRLGHLLHKRAGSRRGAVCAGSAAVSGLYCAAGQLDCSLADGPDHQ